MEKQLLLLLFLAVFSTWAADTLPNGCPSDIHVHKLLPHEDDCSKFYQCSHGQKIELTCAAGTLFDYTIQVCNWPQAVKCASPTEPETETPEEIIETTTEQVELTTEAALCPIDVFGNIPHPTLCTTFYMCVGGNAIQLYCSEGFEYDVETEQCIRIAAGGCTDRNGDL